MCGELYAQRAGVKLVQVPYPGSPQVIIDLMAGRVAMNFAIASSVLGQIAAGQVKPLAIAADKRSDLLPDVPTMAEAGMPDFNTPLWFGLLAPKGTPQPAIDKLAAAAHEGHACAGSRGRAAQTGFCAGGPGTGPVRRFHQERNRALVAGRAGGGAGEDVSRIFHAAAVTLNRGASTVARSVAASAAISSRDSGA